MYFDNDDWKVLNKIYNILKILQKLTLKIEEHAINNFQDILWKN